MRKVELRGQESTLREGFMNKAQEWIVHAATGAMGQNETRGAAGYKPRSERQTEETSVPAPKRRRAV